MRCLVLVACICFFILTLNTCNQNQDAIQLGDINVSDSATVQEYEMNDIIYSVPSPHQISLLIREDYPAYEESIFNKRIDINTYSTSEKRALVLGALCADLGYLSLYDQKDLQIQYLDYIRKLIVDSRLDQINHNTLFQRIDKNLGNSDSIITIMSDILRLENETIRTGERPYLSSLIVAGGWIESFYILNTVYNNSKNSNLFGILLQQQFVLENLIHSLRPYYKKSSEFTELVDSLVDIAYDYEVVDVHYKNHPIESTDSTTIVKCRFTPILAGSQLDKMYESSHSLRMSIIN